jgi:hypothetical protein
VMADERAPGGVKGVFWRAAEWTALTAALGWLFVWAWTYYSPADRTAASQRPTPVRTAEASRRSNPPGTSGRSSSGRRDQQLL